jgi:cell division septal protein FtsQ
MSSHQRKASHSRASEQLVPGTRDLGAAAGERWRQPPPDTRAKVRRQQMAVRRVDSTHDNPLARVISRGMELMQSTPLRQWMALFAIVAAAAAVTQLLTLDRFTVTATNVQMRGNQRTSTDEIYAASGLEGANIFQVQADKVAGRVTNVPGVASALVHLRLPARVIIDVEETAPLAILHTITETLWIGVDGRGIQQADEPPKFTLIQDGGVVRDAHGTVLPEIVEGLEAIRARRPELTEVHYGALEGLYLRAPEGYTVYLGEGREMTRKLALLEATESQIADRGLRPQVVDLRFDGYAMLK